MAKAPVLIAVNSALFTAACVQAISGFALIWGGIKFLYIIHRYNGIVLSVLIVIHLSLNWGWVKSFVLPARR